MNPTTGGDTFLLITIIGFGIQQFVQVVIDPFYTLAVGRIRRWKATRRTNPTAPAPAPGLPTFSVPGQISDVDSKKMVLGLITIAMAWLVVENGPDSMRL